MDWLYRFGVECHRLNGDNIIDSTSSYHEISDGQDVIRSGVDQTIDISKVSAVWFRRWSDRNFITKFISPENSNTTIPYQFLENINLDYHVLRNYIIYKLSKKPFISNPLRLSQVNKLIGLTEAKKIGLQVPETILCNNKEHLREFLFKKRKIITKDIENSAFVKVGNYHYSNFTNVIDDNNINEVPNSFSISAFQEHIEKSYELRIFYFFGKVYSMAIFSQNDPKTTVDFRRYNMSKPNRTTPYNLPAEIEIKIINLMKRLKLETGSIDLIRTTIGNYVFLEVNPVGQFMMVSRPCNYRLEQKIAKKLKYYEKNHKVQK